MTPLSITAIGWTRPKTRRGIDGGNLNSGWIVRLGECRTNLHELTFLIMEDESEESHL
jgi:hypothetical protein